MRYKEPVPHNMILGRDDQVAIQQPGGDDKPDIPATAAPSLGMARLDVPDITELPTHGAAATPGVGTMISGLRPDAPASVAADGMVASPYDSAVMVARPGIGATSVLLKNSVRF